MTKLLTVPEAAEATGMTPRTLRRRIAAGELSAIVDPRDRRRHLLKIVDLKRNIAPVELKQAS